MKGNSHYFFQDQTFETIFLTSLGRAYHSGASPGKSSYLTRQAKDGDFESAFAAFRQAGDEARAQTEGVIGRRASRERQASVPVGTKFLRQRNLLCRRISRPVLFSSHLAGAIRLLVEVSAVVRSVDRAGRHSLCRNHCTGFHLRGKSKARRRPLLTFINGSDGSLLDMWLTCFFSWPVWQD
jgi:hypothetical protein